MVAREPMPEKFFELITESVRILREKNAFCSLGFSQPSCPKDRPKDHGEKSLEQRAGLDSPNVNADGTAATQRWRCQLHLLPRSTLSSTSTRAR